MDMPKDNYIPLEDPAWDDEAFNPNVWGWIPGATNGRCLTVGEPQDLGTNASPSPAFSTGGDSRPQVAFPGLSVPNMPPDTSVNLDYGDHDLMTSSSGFSPVLDFTSAENGSLTRWAATASSEFSFRGSSVSWELEASYQSPTTPIEPSPLDFSEFWQFQVTEPQLGFGPPQQSTSEYMVAEGTSYIPFVPTAQETASPFLGNHLDLPVHVPAPGAEIQAALSQSFITTPQVTMEDRPPNISARQWRYITKPVKCPECPKRFDYHSNLKRHIAAKHKAVASLYNVSITQAVCKWCGNAYGRKDYLIRHLTAAHGRQKTRGPRRGQ